MKSVFKKFGIFLLTVLLGLMSSSYLQAANKTEFIGAGATFPYPLYSKMFNVYFQKNRIKINYQSIGSGGGIRQLLSKTVDFGGTDAFMSDEELKKADGTILHIPICLGAVALTYNLSGNPKMKFTPGLIAAIFLGKITKWNDPEIAAVNPGVSLPDKKIAVVHRSDGSGTTFIFSDYLTKISSEWKEKVARGKSLNWPVGLGAKGNPGVAGLIKQIDGTMGYVELIYALANNMPAAAVKNRSGNFITPSIESVSLAANVDLPVDTRVSITDTLAEKGYPISGFTWIIFYKEQSYRSRSREKAKELVNLLWWMTHEGQSLTRPLHYAPLPEAAISRAESILKSVVYKNSKLLNLNYS